MLVEGAHLQKNGNTICLNTSWLGITTAFEIGEKMRGNRSDILEVVKRIYMCRDIVAFG